MNLTIAYSTSRENPCLNWFIDSLRRQLRKGEDVRIIITDFFADRPELGGRMEAKFKLNDLGLPWKWTEPMPTVWQGKYKVTKDEWWATAGARNTSICLCETDHIVFVDDRCVLLPGWLDGIREAMDGKYIVAGAYEKRHGMIVTDGVITHGGIIQGEVHDRKRVIRGTDDREFYCISRDIKPPFTCGGEWLFGCVFAMPLEMALTVNGVDTTCDGLGMEDVIFGLQLANNGFPVKYDWRIKIIEDRTPSELGKPMKREDKGVSPNDKSHAMLAMLRDLKHANHPFDIRQLRKHVLNGGQWPLPTWPTLDWYDQTPIAGI